MAVKQRITTKGLLLIAGALFVASTSAAFAAFDSSSPEAAQIMSRLGQLETQVQTLSRSLYRGDTPPPALSSAGDPGDADRLSQLDQQQRSLTGQLEQVSHQAQELQIRLDKMQADMEARLTALEQGKAASVPAASSSSYPPQPQSAPPGQTLGAMPVDKTDTGTSDALYNSAFADIRDSKYESAETKFRQFLSQYPSDTKAGNAQYWLSETYYVRGDYKTAAKMFAQGYQDYPQSPKASDSLLKLGLSLEKMDKKDDACLSFQQLLKQFPGDTVPANRRARQEMKDSGCK